jgi:heat shock protein HslJ
MRTTRIALFTGTLAAAFVSFGCGNRREAPAPPPESGDAPPAAESSLPGEAGAGPALEGADWALVTVGTRMIDSTMANPPSIRLDPAEKKMSGFGGCNRMFGSYEMDGASLQFGGMGATRMMCQDTMDLETEFMAALGATRSFAIRDGLLALADSAGTPLALLRPAAAPTP